MTAQRERWETDFTIYARSELQLALMKSRFPGIRTIIGDVRDYDRLQSAVAGHDGVIHAAAMKRLPECEESPRECYLTNVVGSENVARACYGRVEWVVGISTDKACQASTTYGASKLLLESIFLNYGKRSRETRYHLVRYGNVVGSNGSVIPFWRSKYEKNEPLPITDVQMTRFWMSPFDAVHVIQQGLASKPGLIFVPKVRAALMTSIAVHLFSDCRFIEVGLRSNEKRHESLVSTDENSVEFPACFIVGTGATGNSYQSSSVDTLTGSEFERMLRDAEEVER